MNYRETLDYLYSQLPMFQRIGPAAYKADLSNTIALCRLLGNPENAFRSIHVAGTNGKGTVSHLIASVLQEAGYKTGLYTSPHLKDFRERIRINGQMIPEGKVVDFIGKYREKFEGIGLSFFEMTVGMAFDYFREEEVDIAVIEAGMGGRLDSTNVITPLLSVITNIGYDHMQFLGDTLEKIAREKAAIIKPGIPVVIGERQESVEHVFEERAMEMASSLCYGPPAPDKGLQPLLEAAGKDKNLATVQAVIEQLRLNNFYISDEQRAQGIMNVTKNTGLRGRWEKLRDEPLTICDVGHNRDGITEVMKMIDKTPHRKLHFVLGMVADKHIEPVLALLPATAEYYFCKADIPRGMDALKLRQAASGFGLKGTVYPTVMDAYQSALQHAGKDDLVFVGGSTFVVAEVL